jgi:hypothetical protein
LKTAVRRILKGRNRQEQDRFITFRSCFGSASNGHWSSKKREFHS